MNKGRRKERKRWRKEQQCNNRYQFMVSKYHPSWRIQSFIEKVAGSTSDQANHLLYQNKDNIHVYYGCDLGSINKTWQIRIRAQGDEQRHDYHALQSRKGYDWIGEFINILSNINETTHCFKIRTGNWGRTIL